MAGVPLINVSQLLTFYFVGKEANITAAAEKLCITQPAVTKQIRALQNRFGVKLIHVKRKRVYLTEDGEKLFDYAEEIYHAVVKAESFLKTDRNSSFRVGVSSSLTAYLTPILDAFRESDPGILISVKEGASVQLIEELLEYQHDLCLVPSLHEVSNRLKVVHLPRVEKMVLVTSPDGPFSAKEEIAWKDLQGCPFILHRDGSVLRKLILDHFQARDIRVHVAANIDSIPFMKSLVERGKGVAMMLPAAVREEMMAKRLKALSVADGDFWLDIDIVMQKEITLSSACTAFLRLLEAHFGRELASRFSETVPVTPTECVSI